MARPSPRPTLRVQSPAILGTARQESSQPAPKRIIFVDDEPMVLQGLQRMLRSFRSEWSMRFVSSGDEALEVLAVQPYDVIVSDMRMPGMNGAELLDAVMKSAPGTIRLVLSGHADRQLIMDSVRVAHQYMAKPCEPDVLKSIIGRVLAENECLACPRLRTLLTGMCGLPSAPQLRQEASEQLLVPEQNLRSVGQIIARDLGLATKVLQLVNSAFFGFRRQISDPVSAVTQLGFETIRALLSNFEYFSQCTGWRAEGLDLNELSTHSLKIAAAARAIAAQERYPKIQCEVVYLAGLLHDVGKLLLSHHFPQEYVSLCNVSGPGWQVDPVSEHARFGADHAMAGAYLLGLWGLPAPVVNAVRAHHKPPQVSASHIDPAIIVHAAEILSGDSGSTIDEVELKGHFHRLGLADRFETWRALIQMEVRT